MIDLLTATSIINPSREIHYDVLRSTRQLRKAGFFEVVKRNTSILWYREWEFTSLFEDYIRATPDLTLTRFITMFRYYNWRVKQAEIL